MRAVPFLAAVFALAASLTASSAEAPTLLVANTPARLPAGAVEVGRIDGTAMYRTRTGPYLAEPPRPALARGR